MDAAPVSMLEPARERLVLNRRTDFLVVWVIRFTSFHIGFLCGYSLAANKNARLGGPGGLMEAWQLGILIKPLIALALLAIARPIGKWVLRHLPEGKLHRVLSIRW
jgi:hypothetical protein